MLEFTEPPLKEEIPRETCPFPMSTLGRIVLIVVLGLAFSATVVASWPLTDWLKRVLNIPRNGYVSYDEIVAEMLTRTALLVVWSLPLLVLPQLRGVGSLRLTRTWTPLLVAPILALNIYFFGRIPVPIPFVAHLALVCNGVLPAMVEELVFRGYAFRRCPDAHPRLVVLTSTACFTLGHLVNIGSSSIASVLATFPFVFACGLSLGVIRMASGSLAWSMLAHGTVNASSALAMTGGTREQILPFVTGIVGVSAVTTFCLHKTLQGRSLALNAPK